MNFSAMSLDAYCSGAPESSPSRADRMLAAQLHQRGVAVTVIENAFALAAVRRLMRPADAPPLGTIRSLAYFLAVIEEVLEMRVSTDYFQYIRRKLERIAHDQ